MTENIRPLTFDDFTGQPDSVTLMQIAINSAMTRNKPLGHVLISGPAGTGKTTFSEIITNELGVGMERTIGNSIGKDIDVLNMIRKTSRLERINILFIDEIHTIRPAAQNNLLTAMEDSCITVKTGNHSQRYAFTPIIIVGATTNPGKLLKPVYDRFDHKLVFETYTISELTEVVKFTVSKLDDIKAITKDAALDIAKRARGIPRIATKFVKFARDVATTQNTDTITMKILEKSFDVLHIDKSGLNKKVDIKILKHLFNIFPDSIGSASMAQLLDEDSKHVTEIVEPNLFKLGYIDRKKSGRVITAAGMAYLKEQGHISIKDVENTAVVAID